MLDERKTLREMEVSCVRERQNIVLNEGWPVSHMGVDGVSHG
jgi:hypothetical protein